MDGLDWQGAVKDIEASVNWLKANGSKKSIREHFSPPSPRPPQSSLLRHNPSSFNLLHHPPDSSSRGGPIPFPSTLLNSLSALSSPAPFVIVALPLRRPPRSSSLCVVLHAAVSRVVLRASQRTPAGSHFRVFVLSFLHSATSSTSSRMEPLTQFDNSTSDNIGETGRPKNQIKSIQLQLV
ncbi:hypothetical protein AHAS_Ahas17G0109800 [Arachis hypogaea]